MTFDIFLKNLKKIDDADNSYWMLLGHNSYLRFCSQERSSLVLSPWKETEEKVSGKVSAKWWFEKATFPLRNGSKVDLYAKAELAPTSQAPAEGAHLLGNSPAGRFESYRM